MPLLLILGGCNSNDDDIFQGYVEGDYAYISSAISGKLTQRLVNRGDKVSANQPLIISTIRAKKVAPSINAAEISIAVWMLLATSG